MGEVVCCVFTRQKDAVFKRYAVTLLNQPITCVFTGSLTKKKTTTNLKMVLMRTKFKQEKPSTEIPTSDPGNKSGMSDDFGADESSSKGVENVGSSGRRKRSRWDSTPQADEQNVVDGVVMGKPRKTRWDNGDSKLKLLGPIQLPDLVKGSANKALGALAKKAKFCKKVYIPVKEYPEYNFIGLILGPHGMTQKRMEKETGAIIRLRGKGSQKDGTIKDGDDDDLHVLVYGDDQKSVDAAVAMVEKLLVPVEDYKNEHKLSQLRELAELRAKDVNKTGDMASKMDGKCDICGDSGHHSISCLFTRFQRTKKDKNNYLCKTCGDAGHDAIACPFSGTLLQTKTHENNVNHVAAVGGGSSLFTVTPLLGNQSLDFKPAADSMPFCSDKFKRDVNHAILYVDHLPQYVDEGRLVQLFSPFGALSYAQVIRDKATGLSKGCAFVKYFDPSSTAMAVNQMTGFRIDEKMMVVRLVGQHELGTPGSLEPVQPTSISYPAAYPNPSAMACTPAPTSWPGLPGSMLRETYNSSYANPVPSSLISTHSVTSEELARFPGNPDSFASGYPSLFS